MSAVSRRRFLEHLGVVGGTSLVFSALTSWELMAGGAGQRPALSGRPPRTKVLVLGAGVSGLVVAYELGRLGYDYHVLEARDRVGGMAWTVRRGTGHTEIDGERQVCTFADGLYVNAGAWRIPYTHTGVLNYCRELGVALERSLTAQGHGHPQAALSLRAGRRGAGVPPEVSASAPRHRPGRRRSARPVAAAPRRPAQPPRRPVPRCAPRARRATR